MLRALVLLAVVVAATQAASVVKRRSWTTLPYAYYLARLRYPYTYYPYTYYLARLRYPYTYYPYTYYGTNYYYLLCLTNPRYCTGATQSTPQNTTTPLKLCPPGTGGRRKRQAVDNRLLNGDVLDECKGDGIIGFQTVVSGTHVAVCNGVVAPDPANPTSYVIYTDPWCLEALKVVRDDPNLSVDGTVYGTTIPNVDAALDLDNVVTTNGVTVVKPTILGKYFFANAQSTCESAACVYKASTMASYIDKTKCYVASYGVTIQTGVASPGGNRVDIKLGGTCANAPTGSECFTALNNTQSPCSSDTAAPVYCATTTGEEVLYGILPASSTCDLKNPTFNVLPI